MTPAPPALLKSSSVLTRWAKVCIWTASPRRRERMRFLLILTINLFRRWQQHSRVKLYLHSSSSSSSSQLWVHLRCRAKCRSVVAHGLFWMLCRSRPTLPPPTFSPRSTPSFSDRELNPFCDVEQQHHGAVAGQKRPLPVDTSGRAGQASQPAAKRNAPMSVQVPYILTQSPEQYIIKHAPWLSFLTSYLLSLKDRKNIPSHPTPVLYSTSHGHPCDHSHTPRTQAS